MISIEDDQRVRLVTFRRPEVRNAFDTAMYTAVGEALDEARERDDLAVVVFTGEGSAYCAGQDLAEMGRLGHRDERDVTVQADVTHHGFSDFFGAIEAFPKPILAAVNGVAIGLGTTMLPYCDIVLASRDARFRLPFARLGVVPEAGSTFTLPRMMGAQAAAYAFYTSEWIDAETALRYGLVFRLCPAEMLLDEALELAAAIARMPLVSLVETKRLLLETRLDDARAARWREESVFAQILAGPANREAMAAFLEKREPDFTDLPAE